DYYCSSYTDSYSLVF
nr:immunoglobulin light chain junction region [Macaca mulatta]